MNWESSPESGCVGQPGCVGTVATRTPDHTGLASILEQRRSSDVLIPQLALTQAFSRSPPICKHLRLRSNTAHRLTLAIAAEEEHEVPVEERGLKEIAEEEEEEEEGLHQSGMVRSGSSRVPGLGFRRPEEQEIADTSNSANRASKFELCIGSFGPIPFDDGAEETTSEGTSCSSSTYSEEVCSTRIASRRRGRVQRTSDRGEIEAALERQSSERFISTVCSSAKGKAGSYSLRKWLEEGSQGGICSASVQSSCVAVREETRGNGGRSSKRLLREPLQGAVDVLSGPCDKGRMMGFRWEEEVEPFFYQLWNIPQHPTKPFWVQKGVGGDVRPVRVSVPTQPPPPLPPDSSGLFCLGEEGNQLLCLRQ
jgi:hypothetical protein